MRGVVRRLCAVTAFVAPCDDSQRANARPTLGARQRSLPRGPLGAALERLQRRLRLAAGGAARREEELAREGGRKAALRCDGVRRTM